MMPYGAEVTKLDSVYLAGQVKIAVYPEVMKMFNLTPDQTVDDDTAEKILAENQRMYMAKQ
jgi:hypothetical protein